MSSITILVTGANRGIGFAIVQNLLQRIAQQHATARDTYDILVASRVEANADEAIAKLHALDLFPAQDSQASVRLVPLVLDVTDDASVEAAVQLVKQKFGKLDVLINNAGIAAATGPTPAEFRSAYTRVFDTNVTSIALLTNFFLPLLQSDASARSRPARVINISSGRGSFNRVLSGQNPPTQQIPYSISKAALNLLTVELGMAVPDVEFQAVHPGHCKTGFNNFRGSRDPLEGAEPAAELALAEKDKYRAGFWGWQNGAMDEVPW